MRLPPCAYTCALVLVPTPWQFIHTHGNVRFPEGGGKKIYSCNEGNSVTWDDHIKGSVQAFKETK